MILLIKIILSIILSDRIDRINSLTKLAEESFRKENYNESIINYRLLIDSFNYSNEKLYLNLAHSHLLSKDTLNAIENYNYASLTDNMKIKSIALQQLGNISSDLSSMSSRIEGIENRMHQLEKQKAEHLERIEEMERALVKVEQASWLSVDLDSGEEEESLREKN